MYDYIIVGAGFAGSVSGRVLAEKGKKVLLLEEREHVGGNAYDETDRHGILVHIYGPHIFHTCSKEVFDFLQRFAAFHPYHHKVLGNIHGKLIPVPFNLNSLSMIYEEEKAKRLEESLISAYGAEENVPILKLRASADPEIRELAEYIYENVFVHYTMKQWGVTPNEIDPAVTARVPVALTRKDGYFKDIYQAMPEEGFTKMFERMLDHENIEVRLGGNALKHLRFENGKIFFDGEEFTGGVIYSGMVDVLFDRKYGALPYRALRFDFEHHDLPSYQEEAVVNYTVSGDFTRITEFKKLTGQEAPGTTIIKEYSFAYDPEGDLLPYYAVLNDKNKALYEKYKKEASGFKNLHLLGRLAEYKYYNMDAITKMALDLGNRLD